MVPLHWVTSKTLHRLDSAFYPPQDGEMTPSFGLSNSNTWRWWVYTLAAYRRTRSPSRLAWSEDWRPLGAVLHSSNEPDEVLQWLCRDDSTINIVLELLLLFFFCSSVVFLLYVCFFVLLCFYYYYCCLLWRNKVYILLIGVILSDLEWPWLT